MKSVIKVVEHKAFLLVNIYLIVSSYQWGSPGANSIAACKIQPPWCFISWGKWAEQEKIFCPHSLTFTFHKLTIILHFFSKYYQKWHYFVTNVWLNVPCLVLHCSVVGSINIFKVSTVCLTRGCGKCFGLFLVLLFLPAYGFLENFWHFASAPVIFNCEPNKPELVYTRRVQGTGTSHRSIWSSRSWPVMCVRGVKVLSTVIRFQYRTLPISKFYRLGRIFSDVLIFEPTRWAHMHRFLSVVWTGPKKKWFRQLSKVLLLAM